MAASLITVLIFCQLMSASADQQITEITAQPGDDVTLPCPVPNDVNIARVELIRSDLNRSVCTFQDKQLIPELQDPSYKNRVQLKDEEMKNGGLSLVLKKVKSSDGGRYQCHYVEKRGGRRKRGFIEISPINFNFNFNFNLYVGMTTGIDKEGILHTRVLAGGVVLLPCLALNYLTITTIEWTKSGLIGSVCSFQNRQIIPKYQHPSYENRVQLRDPEMKNGDVSLVLMNVNTNDEGRYQCLYEGTKGENLIKLNSTVYLEVVANSADGKHKHQHLGVILSVTLIVGLVFMSDA